MSILLATLLSVSAAPLADVFVDAAAAGCATGAGTEADPVCTISAGILIAQPGDTIRIAPGTYVENLSLGFDLDLIGTAGASVTTLDGSGNPGTSVVTIPAAVTVEIEGLTITGGLTQRGGGIDLAGALRLRNSTITGNETFGPDGGGGIFASSASFLSIEESAVNGNTASYRGGGVTVEDGMLFVRRSELRDNLARHLVFDYLGAQGGGIYADAGSVVEITDSTVQENVAEGGFGGGIRAVSGVGVTVERSTFAGNTCGTGGGGLSLNGPFVIRNSTITQNASLGYIGPGNGGGLLAGFVISGELSNVTVTENTVFGYGGGVAASSQVLVHNSIIAENDANSLTGGLWDVSGMLVSDGYNLIGRQQGGVAFVNGVNGDLVGTPTLPLDPLLGPLQDNGGPTLTRAPLGGSPALDAADPSSFEPIDQRGEPRPQTDGPDIGAVEADGILRDLCNGDGGDQAGCSPCPCGNEAPQGTLGGCLHDGGDSMRILASGSNSITLGNLRIEATGGPAATPTVLVSGAALAPANPLNPCFGLDSGVQAMQLDGLRCVVQDVLRHGLRTTDANGSIGATTSGWGDPDGFFQFAAFMAGDERQFQLFFRQPPAAVCQTGQNTSQAVSVTFVP